MNSGIFHMSCLPRMEFSEALVKETCSFLRRDGNMLVHVQRSGDKFVLIISSCQGEVHLISLGKSLDSFIKGWGGGDLQSPDLKLGPFLGCFWSPEI